MPALEFSHSTTDIASPSLLSFSPAITQHAILACHMPFPADYIIAHILNLSEYLISLEANGNFFSASEASAYSPSLRVLHKRLTEGYRAPSMLPTPFLTPSHVDSGTVSHAVRGAAKDRPLADFEHLYYALLARMREMQRRMVDHIISGFSTLETPVYAGGPTIASLHSSLASYWDVLNDASCGKAMDEAVREARVQCIHDEIVAQVQANCVVTEDAEAQILQLRERDVYDAQEGLDWTPEWDAALVNAKLKEKYRTVFEQCRRQDRMENKRMKIAQRKKRGFENEQAAVPVEAAEQQTQEDQVMVDSDAAEEERVSKVNQEQTAHVSRGEQEWMCQVEQLQHPALREGFNINAQDQSDLNTVRADQEQLRYFQRIARVESVEKSEQAQPSQSAQPLYHLNEDDRLVLTEQSHQTPPIEVAVAQQQEELIDIGNSQQQNQALSMPGLFSLDLHGQQAYSLQPNVAQESRQHQVNIHNHNFQNHAVLYPQRARLNRDSYDLELRAQRQRVSTYTSYLREHVGGHTRAMMGYF